MAATAAWSSQQFWDNRQAQEAATGIGHIDWLCSYSSLAPLIEPVAKQPRSSVLVIGAGASSFPEELYDSGVREVVVVDGSQAAIQEVQQRNLAGGRKGLRCLCCDVCDLSHSLAALQHSTTQVGTTDLSQHGNSTFNLIIDKGTLDCVLADQDGQARAQQAIAAMYEVLKTPGTLLMVSHSPPPERLQLLQTVYWHDIKVKYVCSTDWHKLASDGAYTEQLVDWDGSPGASFQPGSAYVYVLTK